MTDGLARIHVEGLRSIRDVTLEPGRLTVMIGPNGSGKSNVLRALRLAPLLRTRSLQNFVVDEGGASSLLHYGPKRTQAISLELEFHHGENAQRYSVRLGFAAGDRLLFLDESVSFRPRSDGPWKLSVLGAGHSESVLGDRRDSDTTARVIHGSLSRMTFFHFHDTSMTSALRTNARAEDNQYLRSNGSNLAAYLLRIKEGEDEGSRAAWRRISDLVRRIAPCVKELQPTLSDSAGRSVRLDWTDDRDEVFGSHHLSDGTLRAIGLITALAQPADRLPEFLSVDEPELGLHPAAISILAELARSVSRRCQVLFATQSTSFLDHFDPSEVVVAERENGETVLKRLDLAELESWLDDYSLSEIYEKGVLGGRP